MKNTSKIISENFENQVILKNLENYFRKFQEIFREVPELLPQFSELFLKNSKKQFRELLGTKKNFKTTTPQKKFEIKKKIDATRNRTKDPESKLFAVCWGHTTSYFTMSCPTVLGKTFLLCRIHTYVTPQRVAKNR